MTELTHIPQGVLAPYIKFIWFCDGYMPQYNVERVLPAGSSQIIINLGHDNFRHFKDQQKNTGIEYTHTIVVGVNSRYLFLDSTTRQSTMGIVLKPGGIQALFGIPGNEFLDHAISLSDVIRSDVSVIRQQLVNAQRPETKFQLLESFLVNLLNKSFRPNPGIIYAARLIKSSDKSKSISDIADSIGYSSRRLSELFKNIVGIAPKEFSRIQRFQQSLQLIRQASEPNWSQVALSCGYYDQPHFNHEFKALSGLTPTQYFENQTGETNHLPA